jgi:hypothetical protein
VNEESVVPTVAIEAKVVGQKRPLVTDYQLPLPPELTDSGRMTLRDLITCIVVEEVDAFRQRQEERRLAQVLSPKDIERGAQQGKIDSGERDLQQDVDDDAAVATALQAFEDGLYYVFLDDVQQESLDQTVFVGEDSRVMFIRLVALAGG